MDFETVIRERFSVRKFSNKKITREQLNQILEAGRIAPTAKNLQAQKIFVIESEEGLAKIDKISPCRYGAQTVLLVCSDKSLSFKKESGFNSYEMDASIVTTHMMLEATNIGVDNIWIEMFDENLTKSEFDLSDNLEPICLLPLGFREKGVHPAHLHNEKKDLSELVEYL